MRKCKRCEKMVDTQQKIDEHDIILLNQKANQVFLSKHQKQFQVKTDDDHASFSFYFSDEFGPLFFPKPTTAQSKIKKIHNYPTNSS